MSKICSSTTQFSAFSLMYPWKAHESVSRGGNGPRPPKLKVLSFAHLTMFHRKRHFKCRNICLHTQKTTSTPVVSMHSFYFCIYARLLPLSFQISLSLNNAGTPSVSSGFRSTSIVLERHYFLPIFFYGRSFVTRPSSTKFEAEWSYTSTLPVCLYDICGATLPLPY